MTRTASTHKGGPRITVLLSVALLILFSVSLLPTTHAQASSSGVWWVGAQSVDGSALPNTGVQAKIQVANQYFSGCLSFWVSESELSNGDWAQVGYFICSGSTPVAFYQVWNMAEGDVLAGGTASVSTGAHTFSLYVASGTTWAFALDGSVFGTYNMGSTQTTTSPVYAFSEQSSVSSPQAITQVKFYTAMNVLRGGVWQPVTYATSYGNAWGLAGNAQDSQLPSDSMLIGGGASSLSQGTTLWNGAQTIVSSTSTSLTCSPSSLNVGSSSTCTATVTDTSSGASATPTGAVSFASTGSGTFNPSVCTLAGTDTSSTCGVTYAPTASGADTITATYAGDSLHYGSSGAFTLVISTLTRSTSTSLACSPSSLQVGSSSMCTATVTDIASGTSITPTGTVYFDSTGPGAFSPSACTLAGTGPSSVCAVTYTPSGSGTDVMTATYGGDSIHSGSSRTFILVIPTLIGSTSTSLACSPSSLSVGSYSTCTATVTDTSSGISTTPTGTIYFGSTGSGTFNPSACTLAGTGASSTCTVTYAPAGSGTDTIMATYGGDLLHYSSFDTFTLVLSTLTRSTSTSVACSPSSLQVGSSSTCIATVTDIASGTSITPTGAVYFDSTGLGTFSPSSCTLAGTDPSSVCAVTYTPAGIGTDTITATYGGDSIHSGSSRTFTLVMSGAQSGPSGPSGTLGIDGSGTCANGNANSCEVVLTTSSTSSVIIVAEATPSGHAAEAPSDTSGLTWVSLNDYSDGNIDLHLYYAMATGTLNSDTITCNFDPNARSSCAALGISGADQTTVFDQNPAAPCSAGGTSTTSSCNISTTNSDDMVIGFAAASCDTPLTADSGFTAIRADVFCGPSLAVEYQIVSSTQTNHPVSFTLGQSSEEWVTMGEAIMQSGS